MQTFFVCRNNNKESMQNLQYSFKTKPFSHQLAAMGAMLNHFIKGNREFALAVDGLIMRSGVQTADKKYYNRAPKHANLVLQLKKNGYV